MPRSCPRAVVCALAVFVTGCGTIRNFNRVPIPGEPPPCKVLGGVRSDVDDLTQDSEFSPLVAVLVAIDLPLSLVGDVVTLPWTLKAAREREASGIRP